MTDVPTELKEIMSYLAYVFSKSMRHPVYNKDDLYQDLVVLYLENKDGGAVSNVNDKNQWYVFFKSRLVNQYRRILHEKRLMEELSKYAQINLM